MNPLQDLIAQARALTNPESPIAAAHVQEVARQMQICNACRYCEGFCAVFPAMTRRLEFGPQDVHYLANLCHNCGACLHACQYAPPHEFAVNVPRAMAEVRRHTYATHAWPAALGALYLRNGVAVALALAIGLSLFLALAVAREADLMAPLADGNFYAVFPHRFLVALFLPVFGFAVLALGIGATRFWCAQAPAADGEDRVAARGEALRDATTLRYLGGGHGQGCNNEDDRWTLARRRAHHVTVVGFMLCLADSSLGTLYHHVFGWVAPYDLPSLPKLLGAVGGVALMLGSAGLCGLHLRRHPDRLRLGGD